MVVKINDKAIIVGIEYLNLKEFPKLEVIGCNCTGTDHLPWKQIKERSIKVISLQGHNEFLKHITSTAEHTFGLILSLLRNYKKALNSEERELGYKLSGKTICLIGGNGRIGRQMRKIADGFGMKVVVHEKYEKHLDKKLQESDIVSIHIPLDGNENFFTKEMFKLMKPTAYLINTSRDKVVEEDALLWALKNKLIAGAGIDFIDDKKLVKYSKMYDNIIITNHLGGNTYEDTKKTREFIKKLVENYLNN